MLSNYSKNFITPLLDAFFSLINPPSFLPVSLLELISFFVSLVRGGKGNQSFFISKLF